MTLVHMQLMMMLLGTWTLVIAVRKHKAALKQEKEEETAAVDPEKAAAGVEVVEEAPKVSREGQ